MPDMTRDSGQADISPDWALRKFRFEDFDDVPACLKRLDERASDWLSGEPSWLGKQYVEGHVWLMIGLETTWQGKWRTDNSQIRDMQRLSLDFPDLGMTDVWDHQAVLIDGVGCDYPPENVAGRLRTVACTVGLDFIKDETFKVWIVLGKLEKSLSPSWFGFAALGLFRKGLFNPAAFFVERKNDRVVGEVRLPGERGHEIIESSPHAADGIAQMKADLERDSGRKRNCIGLRFDPHNCVTVSIDDGFPYLADVVSVHAGPYVLGPRSGEN